PPDLFAEHLPAKYQDRAPKLVRNDEGNDVWVFGQVVMETAALNAVAGRPKDEYGMEPQSLDEVRPCCYDVDERVKDMDAGGVLASMNFPSFPTFTARTLMSDDLDPVGKTCCDTVTVLSIHLGSSGRLSVPAADCPPDVMITLQPMNIQSAAADLLWSRVFRAFPNLRVALSEGGTGWIPYFLE